MNEEVEFLNFVQKNSQMGVDSIKQLIDIANDENFKNMLESQYSEYKKISESAREIMKKYDSDLGDTNMLQKVQTYLMVGIKTLLDKSPNNIAGMLMQGSVMGIIQIIRRLKQYEGRIEQSVLDLGKKLLTIEERNLEECKKYLGQE